MATFFLKLGQWNKRFLVGDFKQLLFFLIILFVFRPYNLGLNYITIWHLFFTGVLLAAIFNCHHTPRVQFFALSLGIPTFIINWWSLFHQERWIFILALAASLVFLTFSIFSLLSRVVLGKINPDVLRGTICVYFMIGFVFSTAYTILGLLYPGSFHGLAEPAEVTLSHGHYHSEMVYFSFITLLAIGYGDITPTGDIGQVLAVSEGLVGQFYLAILVARIVAAYARRAKL